ncbi:UPF0764 protein C16orf89 homolog [Cloeon dipterum]|uniref:UPF0764 protein C16orf89 homolog n=1 Tax=Cloeon dipterum TaxID=197152 RepID=UPI00321FD297
MWPRTEVVLLASLVSLLLCKGVLGASLIGNDTDEQDYGDDSFASSRASHKKRHDRQHVPDVDGSVVREELLIAEIIDALDRLFDFFHKNLQHLIADGFVGIAIAQGQLKEAVPLVPAHLAPLVDQLILKSGQILDGFDPDVHGVPEIGPGMRILLQPEMWMSFQLPVPKIDDQVAQHALAGQETPDECLGQLLSGQRPCHISADCWRKQLIEPNEHFSYSTTHHLFFYHLAKKLQCKVAGRDLDSLIVDACDKILVEATEIAKADFPEPRRDLFLEQLALCGIEGSSSAEFVRHDWLKEALRWQKPITGCYGLSSRRVKRNEKLVPSGCLVHFSSVAAAALATGLRALLASSF